MPRIVMSFLSLSLAVGIFGGVLLTGEQNAFAQRASQSGASQAPEANISPDLLNNPDIPKVDPAFPHAFEPRTIGSEDAPVKMTVYSSLTCNHCGNFFLDILPKLEKNYVETGKLHITFKEFPFNLPGMHAAMAALCLEKDNFLKYIRAVFSTQASWLGQKNPEVHLKQLASFSGLSPDQYVACTTSKPLELMMLRERVHATNELQITATPTFVFEGSLERIVGAQNYQAYADMIERQLKRTSEQRAKDQSEQSTESSGEAEAAEKPDTE